MSILEPFLKYRTVILTKGENVNMRLSYYLLMIMLLLLLRCSEGQRPEGLLDHEEMVSLMIEVYLAEARISTRGIPRDSAAKLFEPFERSLIAKRGITDSTLYASYAYYLQQPDELERILDAVMDSLNLREQLPTKP